MAGLGHKAADTLTPGGREGGISCVVHKGQFVLENRNSPIQGLGRFFKGGAGMQKL